MKKLIGLWPSPKDVETWMGEQLSPKIKGRVSSFASSRGYFVFLFLNKEEWDLIFHSRPLLVGFRGMYLSPWSIDFNPREH